MRYNVFLLFYFFIQTANLVLGAPTDTDRGSLTADIADSDKSHPMIERNTLGTKSLVKRDWDSPGMGQQACASSTVKDGGQIRVLYELSMAKCTNDLGYVAQCDMTIPKNGHGQVTSRRYCNPDEICMDKRFTNPWEVSRTEVYCRKRMPTTIKFQGSNLSEKYCSPGVTVQDSSVTIMGFSAQFYSDANYNNRATVTNSSIQTDRRGKVKETSDTNGIYLQLDDMVKGETLQACFIRQKNGDATFATLQWAQ